MTAWASMLKVKGRERSTSPEIPEMRRFWEEEVEPDQDRRSIDRLIGRPTAKVECYYRLCKSAVERTRTGGRRDGAGIQYIQAGNNQLSRPCCHLVNNERVRRRRFFEAPVRPTARSIWEKRRGARTSALQAAGRQAGRQAGLHSFNLSYHVLPKMRSTLPSLRK